MTAVEAPATTAAEARLVFEALAQILERGANPDSVEAAIALARDFLARSETPIG